MTQLNMDSAIQADLVKQLWYYNPKQYIQLLLRENMVLEGELLLFFLESLTKEKLKEILVNKQLQPHQLGLLDD